MEWLAGGVFGAFLVALFVIAYIVVARYTDKDGAEKLTTVITVIALAVGLALPILLPADISTVSTTLDSNGERTMSQSDIDERANTLKLLYYALYALVVLFCLIILPFAYFYYEEYDDNMTAGQRAMAACKYVIALIVVVVIIFVVGLFFKAPSVEDRKDWRRTLFDTEHAGDSSIGFAIACLTLVGLVLWVVYAPYGMIAFPLGLIFGKKDIAVEAANSQAEQNLARQRIRLLEAKYLSGMPMSARDRKKLETLRRQERLLGDRSTRIEQQQTGTWTKVSKVLAPFRILFGILGLLVSLFLIVSLGFGVADRTLNSQCGLSCGYVLDQPTYYHPFDEVMLKLAPLFPLDYIVLFLVVIYITVCVLSGVARIGIRFFWVNMFKIKVKKTEPQGLLCMVMVLMLSLLAAQTLLLTIAPQYLTFGSQVYKKGEGVERCTVHATPHCTMSMDATIVNRISVKLPFFGTAYLYAAWATLAFFLLGFIVACCKGRPTSIELPEEEVDDGTYV